MFSIPQPFTLCYQKSLQGQGRGLTKRAPDVWDSAAFSSIFLASSFSCSQAESTPAHTQVTQTVRRFRDYQVPNHGSH